MAKKNFRKEFIGDVLATAFEGGINYWCSEVRIKNDNWFGGEYASEVVANGGVVELIDFEDENKAYELDLPMIISGIAMAVSEFGNEITYHNDGCEVEDYDADFADAAVQYAVFGEVIYG
jgi:hypothetical protein